MARLENKVAIITGAAGGMGEAEARLFAAEGAKVLLADIDGYALRGVVEQITSQGQTAAYLVQDVSSESGWAQVTARAIELFGKIDVLVNNAGVTGNLLAPFEERTLEEFNKVLSVNLVSQFLGTKAVLPYLRSNGGGSIINISSIGGIIGAAGATAYTVNVWFFTYRVAFIAKSVRMLRVARRKLYAIRSGLRLETYLRRRRQCGWHAM